jgi:hypothetical protein
MQIPLRTLFALTLVSALSLVAANEGRDAGVVVVRNDTSVIPITVTSAAPELQSLACLCV